MKRKKYIKQGKKETQWVRGREREKEINCKNRFMNKRQISEHKKTHTNKNINGKK